ncbi:hypothetical protein D9615_007807 [Tricholomella constricta]|uniref:Alpha/beta hydrolase fold-3 domain-containing protein n=1 Tax=Tricholomella constricta TaxID=117010 RepID=A0A8H5H5C8_9AGAR|nr:hypothetical protein D9615_007807 [Tricholomella constricta]
MMLLTFLFSLLLLSPIADARPRGRRRLNDWKKPCFKGECFYDLPDTGRRGYGSLKIWGSPNAISDITSAAGWTLIGCSPGALMQDIRLVCNSEADEARCNHLYRSLGATGKLVRLPENCGKSAFARVARAWVPKDQSLPADVARRIVRRSGVQPLVMALTLDTNFAAMDSAVTGPVSIAISGSTIPGMEGNLTVTPPTPTAGAEFNNFDESITTKLPPLDISQDFPIFSQSLSCPGPPAFDAALRADANVNAHADISLGLAAVGTLVPPELTEFAAFVGLDAQLQATLSLLGNVAGRADTGQITLYQIGLPGLDFPGLLTVGPTFKILGQATADVDVGVDMKVDLSYTVSGAKIIFPPIPDTTSTGFFNPVTAPLKLSVSGDITSTTTAVAHIIPRIDLGVTALGGIAKASVFINLDAHASVRLDLNATGKAGGSIETRTGEITGDASAGVNGCVTAGVGLDSNVGADATFFGLFDATTSVSLFEKDWELFQVIKPSFSALAGCNVPSLNAQPCRMVSTHTTQDALENATFFEKAGLVAIVVFRLPFVLGWTLLTSPFHLVNRRKSWKRVLADKTFYHVSRHANINQLKWATGGTREMYEAWMKGQKLPMVVDELGENARLLWIGPSRTDRVILYFHGGAYFLPMADYVADFWKYVMDDLKGREQESGVAILQYSLLPATFPTQLKQAVLAVQHLLSTGIQLQDIQIAGDSAGGNLALMLFSHILHPVPDVPRLTLSAPFRGVYLMSPWVSLTGETGSMITNDGHDVIGIDSLKYWGRVVLQGLTDAQRRYLEALHAPDDWFKELKTVVERVLVTAGDAECLRDEIVSFAENICKHHDGARFVLQKYGVHNDPFSDFLTREKKKGELTPLILEWFAEGSISSLGQL